MRDKFWKAMVGVWIFWMLLSLAATAAVIYVAWHFIAKFW
jgi:hypothetical protein